MRNSSGAPMRSSSSAMWRLTVGGARFNARAASANEPRSATATSVRKRSRLISRMMLPHGSEKLNAGVVKFNFHYSSRERNIDTRLTCHDPQSAESSTYERSRSFHRRRPRHRRAANPRPVARPDRYQTAHACRGGSQRFAAPGRSDQRMRHRDPLSAGRRRARRGRRHRQSRRTRDRRELRSPHTSGLDIRFSGDDAGPGRQNCERISRHESRLLSDRRGRLAAAVGSGRAHTRRLPDQHPRGVRLLRTRSRGRGRARGPGSGQRTSVSGLWAGTRAQAHARDSAACRACATSDLRPCVRRVPPRHRPHGAARIAAARTRRECVNATRVPRTPLRAGNPRTRIAAARIERAETPRSASAERDERHAVERVSRRRARAGSAVRGFRQSWQRRVRGGGSEPGSHA
ncbi:Acetylglutamate semialdehyde dehydrogenase [Burkholderia dolosa AU0158]|nr:Acetylglutamate semialdehyde dehydrogenase [Burkholderia dolosa AU0158]